jgi:hypothetical protein
MHIQIIVKSNLLEKKRKEKQKRKTQQHRLETNVRVRGFNAGLLARSQFASGRSCDWPTRSRFSVVILDPEQMLRWYTNSTLHCMIPMQHSQW